jgi:hypothetical protein
MTSRKEDVHSHSSVSLDIDAIPSKGPPPLLAVKGATKRSADAE